MLNLDASDREDEVTAKESDREPEVPGFSISIVIPSWNGLHLLRENLPSVQAAAEFYEKVTRSPTEIIVVDDGSRDETVARLPLEFPRAVLVGSRENRGFAGACNLGFRRSSFDLVALLNNDVQIHRDYFLNKALHFVDEGVFAVTARVFEWETPIFTTGGRYAKFRRGFWSVYFNYDVDPDQGSDWVAGRRLLSAYAIGGFATYDRLKLQRIGGFNELMSPFHWEDVDLSYRAWKRGWEVRYEPRSRARHRTSATINSHYRQREVDAVSLRNRLLFHWINLHSRDFLLRHLAGLLVLFLSRILVLDFRFYGALLSAAGHLPQVLSLRREEKNQARRTDRELSGIFRRFFVEAPVHLYYNQRDVIRKHPESRETALRCADRLQ